MRIYIYICIKFTIRSFEQMFENSIKTASPDLPRLHDVASNFHFLSVFFIIIVIFSYLILFAF